MNLKGKSMIGLALTLAAPLIFNGCSKSSASSDVKPGSSAPPSANVVKVAREDLANTLEFAAEFRPYEEIEVHAKVSGYVKDIYVDVGDRVQQGQLLAVLEIPEFKDDLAQASADRRRFEEEIKRAQSEVNRAKASFEETHLTYQRLAAVERAKPNLIAQQEIDDAAGRDRVAAAQVDTAKAALAVAEQQLAVSKAGEGKVKTVSTYSRITAPFSGVITKRFADKGALIQAGTSSNTQAMPLVRLSENARLRLVLPVSESAVARVHLGEEVDIKVQSTGQDFAGHVSRFASKVDPATRTMETEVDVPNQNLRLTPGMYASAKLTLDAKRQVLAVPAEAVAKRDTTPTALVVGSDHKVQERVVTLGFETDTKIEIVSGLDEGDLVIVGNQGQYKPGQLVDPKLMPAQGA
jgi:RND family efflux transporter MFP subunit